MIHWFVYFFSPFTCWPRYRKIICRYKTTTLLVHLTYLYISLPFLHDYDVKMPNFTFQGGRKQATVFYGKNPMVLPF